MVVAMLTGGLFVGLSTVDIAYAVGAYPAEDTKTQADDMFLGAGGPAANAAVTYAYLSGLETTLVTALGTHPLATTAHADLRKNGVTVRDMARGSVHRPPVSSIVVAGQTGTRTIVSMDGSELDAVPDFQVRGLDDELDVMLADGHHPRLSNWAASIAECGIAPLVVDAGRWRDTYRSLLKMATTVICSESFTPPGVRPGDIDGVFDYIRKQGPTFAAVTRGGKPIRYMYNDVRGEIPVNSDGVVDTLGAGDILHGAYCHFHKFEHFPTALWRASEVATESCRYRGTREWMRHWPAPTGAEQPDPRYRNY